MPCSPSEAHPLVFAFWGGPRAPPLGGDSAGPLPCQWNSGDVQVSYLRYQGPPAAPTFNRTGQAKSALTRLRPHETTAVSKSRLKGGKQVQSARGPREILTKLPAQRSWHLKKAVLWGRKVWAGGLTTWKDSKSHSRGSEAS